MKKSNQSKKYEDLQDQNKEYLDLRDYYQLAKKRNRRSDLYKDNKTVSSRYKGIRRMRQDQEEGLVVYAKRVGIGQRA